MVHSAHHGDKSLNCSPAQKPRLAAEQSRLFSRYPLFFRATRNPKAYPSNIAHFGIQCGRGWYPIIEASAREIEHELRTMWCDQVHNPESLSAMDEVLLSDRSVYPVLPFCTDVRHVAGELKMELANGYLCDIDAWGRIRKSIEKAVSSARCVCESCGQPGRFRESYWQHVYCDGCTYPFNYDFST